MPNAFKTALREGRPQIGFWLALASPVTSEIAATAGFDWLLIDNEHAPNDVPSTLAQLQALAAYPDVHAVVRPVDGRASLLKQYLDIGATTLLVPMVETEAEARALVRAVRYPPQGVRGVGSAIARVSRWGQRTAYLDESDDEVCLLVQAESSTAIANLDAIASVDGVDGVFFGPADLSASMGFRGRPQAPEVQSAIEDGIRRVRAAGKAPGILVSDATLARRYLDLGALFVAVGVDVSVLARGARDLAASFRQDGAPSLPDAGRAY